MTRIRWRHASAVAIFAAVVAAAPAVSARPGPPPPRQAQAADRAQPQAQPLPPAQEQPAEPVTAVPAPPRELPVAAPERATVPPEAFLQPADTGDTRHGFSDSRPLPPLCGAGFASDRDIVVDGHVLLTYHPHADKGHIPDDTFRETIAVYGPGAAARFMDELRRAVRACPVNRYPVRRCHEWPDDKATHALLTAPRHGDDAIVIRLTYPEVTNGGPTGELASRLYLAVRIGDVVMVLAQHGYEFAFADPPVFHEIGRRAVQRLTAWTGRR